ncbi:MAG: hypothetical protein OHK0019_29920 [Saprospiraceae bacterium]
MADFAEARLRLLLGAVRWLLYYLVLRSLLTLAFIAIRLTAMSDPSLLADMEHTYLIVVNLLLILLLAVIAYFALRNPAIFDHFLDKAPTVEQQVMLAILPEKEKNIIRPAVALEELAELSDLLRLVMEEEKPWLDPKLTQSRLAEKIGLPPYKLSLALHQGFGQHFNEFVNTYRVAYAQQLLTDPARARDTMYAVALDSGFASEAPFYAAFKKLTGESPAAWRERQKFS